MAECRNCGANPQKESVCLVRVNPLGEMEYSSVLHLAITLQMMN